MLDAKLCSLSTLVQLDMSTRTTKQTNNWSSMQRATRRRATSLVRLQALSEELLVSILVWYMLEICIERATCSKAVRQLHLLSRT